MRIMLCIASLLAAASTAAQTVYKNVQPDGTITYSDRPTEGAEPLKLPEIQLYTAPPLDSDAALAGSSRQAAGERDDGQGYRTFAITSPADDEAVRDNGGNVSITLQLEPELRAGHVIDIRMDGSLIGRGSSTSVSLTNVDRGSHTVQAVITDESGNQVAATDSVTFHLRRVSALLP